MRIAFAVIGIAMCAQAVKILPQEDCGCLDDLAQVGVDGESEQLAPINVIDNSRGSQNSMAGMGQMGGCCCGGLGNLGMNAEFLNPIL